MSIKRVKMRPPGNNFQDTLHPETDSDMVLMNNGEKLEAAMLKKQKKISIGTVAPSAPVLDDIWFDIN